MVRIWSSASTPGSPNRIGRDKTLIGRRPTLTPCEGRLMSSIAMPRISATDQRESLRPLALAAPLLLLLLFSFGAPIVALLSRAVYEPTIANALPRTAAELRQGRGSGGAGGPCVLGVAGLPRLGAGSEAGAGGGRRL